MNSEVILDAAFALINNVSDLPYMIELHFQLIVFIY